MRLSHIIGHAENFVAIVSRQHEIPFHEQQPMSHALLGTLTYSIFRPSQLSSPHSRFFPSSSTPRAERVRFLVRRHSSQFLHRTLLIPHAIRAPSLAVIKRNSKIQSVRMPEKPLRLCFASATGATGMLLSVALKSMAGIVNGSSGCMILDWLSLL